MSKLQRLNDAINYLKIIGEISTQQDIADKMRMHKSTISSAISGNEKYLTDSFLSKFNFAFKCIFNEEWMIKGFGAMLNDSGVQREIILESKNSNEQALFYERMLDKKEKKIEELLIQIGQLQQEIKALKQDKKIAQEMDNVSDAVGGLKPTGTESQG